MRLFIVLLLCLGVATCTPHTPRVQVLAPASQALAGRQGFELIAPETAVLGEMPLRERYAQLDRLLRQELTRRGYRQRRPADLRVYYWLAVQDSPLQFKVDVPPANLLGPYQAIHRLRDATGTLRVRLTDRDERILWEGVVDTGLSPARDSAKLLERATRALTRHLPAAH